MNRWFQQLSAQSGIPRSILLLAVGGFIQSAGNAFMWPLNSLFMHDILGRSLTEAGFLLSAQALVMLLGQFLSGFLADRFGSRRVMLWGFAGAVASLGFIGIFPIWKVYAPGLLLFGLASAFIFVPLNALIDQFWPEGGRRGFNLVYVFNNAGSAVGTALGGIVAYYSFRLVFLSNALAFFLYLLLFLSGIPKQPPVITTSAPPIRTPSPRPLLNLVHEPRFVVLLALSGGILLVWAAYIQLTTVLPLIMTQLGFSLPQYSILWTLNGVFIVTLQPLIQWLIRHWAHSFTRQFCLACLLMGMAFVILLAELPYVSYILAMLVLTLGEMLILPAVPAAAAQIAPEGKSATYQGVAAGASSGGRVLGPILGGIVFDHRGGRMTWILALSFLGCASAVFFLYHRAERSLHRSLSPAFEKVAKDGPT